MEEEWKSISGYEGYEVSNCGRVRSLDRTIHSKNGRYRLHKGRVLKQKKSKKGYLRVNLCGEDGTKTKSIHRLVLEAFIGPCPADMETRHLNGDPADNRLANLRYGTHGENILDIVRHGRHHHANKTHCPQGHELTPENTSISHKRAGCRNCLACGRARAYLRIHPELTITLQELANKYYEAILKEATDDPVIARSREAREIMDRHRAEQNKERNEQQ